jgi:cell shape-determining protein MreC
VSVEQRILDLPAFADYNDRRQLRAIALDVRKLEDRVKQLEQENDAMRADLLLWRDTTDAICSKAGIGFTTEDKP